jgi:hypothetical protein
LAQFSTLEGVEKLNATIEGQVELQRDSLRFQQLSQAATLVGHEVLYEYAALDGTPELARGRVDAVSLDGSRIEFRIGDALVDWNDIKSVIGPEPPQPPAQAAASSDSPPDVEATEN